MLFTKKKDVNYFSILNDMAECSYEAAVKLEEMINDYTNVSEKAKAIHDIEHKADGYLHKLIKGINAAFITPIDREDFLAIGNEIDSITDSIEDVANLFDMLSIRTVEEPAKEMADLIKSICAELVKVVKEFEKFLNSKKLSEYVIEVNHLEEKGDNLYRSTMKSLFSDTQKTVLDVVKWKEIYDYMERIFDTCEDVADLIESSAIKNR